MADIRIRTTDLLSCITRHHIFEEIVTAINKFETIWIIVSLLRLYRLPLSRNILIVIIHISLVIGMLVGTERSVAPVAVRRQNIGIRSQLRFFSQIVFRRNSRLGSFIQKVVAGTQQSQQGHSCNMFKYIDLFHCFLLL